MNAFINELHYDNSGGDVGEFVEVAGPAGTDLTGFSLVFYNGSSSSLSVYATIALSGVLSDSANGFGFAAVDGPSNGIQNGAPDGIALVDPDGAVLEFISYEGVFTAADGPAAGMTSVDIGVAESSGTPVGFSLQRVGTGVAAEDFEFVDPAADTRGAINAGQEFLAAAPVITINEVDADTTGTDEAEFIELYDGGVGGSALDGLVVVLFNGSDNQSYQSFDLDGQVTDENGFFVLGNPGVANVDLVIGASNIIQNGADAVALYTGDAADFPNDTALTQTNLLDAIVYDTNDGDDAELLAGLGLTVQFNEDENGLKDTQSNARNPDGSGDFIAQDATPGASNVVEVVEPVETTLISAIQGETNFSGFDGVAQITVDDISPFSGQTVTISAIVTADFQDGDQGDAPVDLADLNGFFVQEEDADADANPFTSEGLFVFDGSFGVDVQVGDLVEVTGLISEFFGQTQITPTAISVIASNQLAPTATVVDLGATGAIQDDDGNFVVDLEAVEGMLITIPEETTVTELFNLDRFGQYTVSSEGRLRQFTQDNAPDVDGFADHLVDVASRSLVLDDGRTTQNPETIEIIDGNDGVLTSDDSFRMGDTISNLTGVVAYSFDEFRLNDAAGDYAQSNPRPEGPEDVGGSFTVASLNVLNYFTTLDNGVNSTGPDGSLDPRGADDLTRFDTNSDLANSDPFGEFDRQTTKLVNAIIEIDADILGLVELENNDDVAIEALVDNVNEVLGENVYAFISTGFTGTDAITNGVIYKTATANPIGDVAVLETFGEQSFLDPLGAGRGLNRPAVAASFEEIATGGTLTVAVNHFKSKGSLSGLPEDEDQLNGAGNNDATRAEASRILAEWLETDPTGAGVENQLILGDLNAYANELPVTVLEDEGFVDLAELFIGDEARSFVFDGQVGTLDYALANADLLEFVTGATEWHINADEADAIDYNLDFGRSEDLFNGDNAARNSDHDPVIIGIEFDQTFTLEILHAADQEASTGAIVDAPNFSAVLNALRNQDLGEDGVADNTLTLSSGDAFIPGVFFGASESLFGAAGVADIQIQNELGFDAIALGNHEFDAGTGALAALISGQFDPDDVPGGAVVFDQEVFIGTGLEGATFSGTDFPYLSANLDFSTDANLAPLAVDGGQAPAPNVVTSSTVIALPQDQPILREDLVVLASGEDVELIGVVGATTPTLPVISSPGDVTVNPQPFDVSPTEAQLDALAAEIQAEVDALLEANPEMNKVILMAHMQQIGVEQALATRLTDVDVIIAGGSNTRLFDDNDRPRDGDSVQGEYPIFVEDANGGTTAIINTDGGYKYVGRLVIDFDADGNLIADSYDPEISGAFATDAQGVADLGAEHLVDAEIQALVDAVEGEIIASESNVVGFSNVFLNGERSGVDGDAADADGVRTQETNLGNLTADANLAAAQETDASVVVSIKNGGGIRASIGENIVPAGGTEAVRSANSELLDGDGNVIKPANGVSQNDIETTLAFNNGLTLLTLTGVELVAVLEHGISGAPEAQGRFPQVSGVKFSFDPDLDAGARILNAGIFDEAGELIADLVRDGEIVTSETETFRIVTLNFLAGGGDGYPFPTGDSADRVDITAEGDAERTGEATFAADGSEQDALAEFLFANFGTAETAFDDGDLGRGADDRIQNLNFREDDVLPVEDDTVPGGGDDTVPGGGDDTVPGGGDDTVPGGGDDTVPGDGPGEDPNTGGAGADVIIGGAGGDTLSGGGGGDILFGGRGGDVVDGGEGADIARGGAGADTIIGGEGADTLGGGQGRDVVLGGAGDDVIRGGRGADSLLGGGDDDDLRGGSGGDTLGGGQGDDTLRGNSGADLIEGDGGDDSLNGGQGFDTLDGGAGDDTLFGGPGADELTGGEGADNFAFTARSGQSTITDFEDGVDTIQILNGAQSFDDLTITDGDDGAVIIFGAGEFQTRVGDDLIVVSPSFALIQTNVSADVLDETDFVFGA